MGRVLLPALKSTASLIFIIIIFFFLAMIPPSTSSPGEYQPSASLRRMSDGQKYYRYAVMKCSKFPRICRVRGSAGRDCCRGKCVDVQSDGLNCGRCGKRCSFGERCCRGSCVNALFDAKNCGACRRKCRKGTSCRFGMCSYA